MFSSNCSLALQLSTQYNIFLHLFQKTIKESASVRLFVVGELVCGLHRCS